MQPHEENDYSCDEHDGAQNGQQSIQNQSQQTAGVIGHLLSLTKLWKSQLNDFSDNE